MIQYTVRFLPYERTINVPEGETVLRAALEAGVHINASCGGEGVCGKCRIVVEDGAVAGGVSEKISPEDREKGVRLACKAEVCGDVTLRVPVESEMDASVLKQSAGQRRTTRIMEPSFPLALEESPFSHPVEKKHVSLSEPVAGDNVPDTSRLISALRQHHGERRLSIDMDVVRRLPDLLRQADYRVTAMLLRPVGPEGKSRVIDIEAGDECSRQFAVAVDIGTTTVQARLLNLTDGRILAEGADFNGQVSYGEDVITRIITAEKGDGLEKLHDKIIETLNRIIEKMLKEASVAAEAVCLIILAGNTTMTQLLLKINPRYIRRSPYVPAGGIYPPVPARELGLDLGERAQALVFPQISSYVGGDIVAGVMASGMHREEALTLFLDIGTNAEIVIGNRDWLVCAACSAGPAFEGGGIKFGMRAAKGAIEDFSIHPLTLTPMIATIGNVKPRGICGSGLITAVAALFEAGVIDSSGKYNRDLSTERIRQTEDVWEYVMTDKASTQIGRDIALTEIDIENLIRAKGAIYSGCMTLLAEVGMDMDAIERIVIAGGFGSYIDLDRAMAIGLLPEIDPDKVVFIGNSSLLGAQFCTLGNHLRAEVVELAGRITNFELSETSSYMDHYMAALFLPHTDLNRFPNLKARMEHKKSSN